MVIGCLCIHRNNIKEKTLYNVRDHDDIRTLLYGVTEYNVDIRTLLYGVTERYVDIRTLLYTVWEHYVDIRRLLHVWQITMVTL